jgi:hypothetical protein
LLQRQSVEGSKNRYPDNGFINTPKAIRHVAPKSKTRPWGKVFRHTLHDLTVKGARAPLHKKGAAQPAPVCLKNAGESVPQLNNNHPG